MMSRRRKQVTAVVATVGLVLLGLNYFSSRPAKPNILLVLCDTLRPDHLGVYGYPVRTSPEIDRFAGESLVFTRAISAGPWTPPSMASIFTGVIPSVHGLNPPNDRQDAKKKVMRLSDEFTTVAEHLRANGYRTHAITASPWSDPAFGLRQGFEETEVLMRSSAERLNESAFAAIERLKGNTEPFFLYVHYMDVHKRGDNPAAPYSEFKAQPSARWDYEPEVLEQIALYDAELRYFDTHFGKLVDFVKSKGLSDTTAIVLVSDHGEQFKERGRMGHGFSMHSEELHVPLILRNFRGRKGRVDTVVTSRDLFATFLDISGIALPPGTTGRSLLDQDALEARPGVISEGSRTETLKSFTSSDYKRLVLKFDDVLPTSSISSLAEGRIFEVFAPESDPKELEQITDPAAIEELNAEFVASFDEALKHRIQAPRTSMSDETIKNLKTLGYLSGN